MADDKNNPQYEIPLTDYTTINDVEEKPYYEDTPTPVDKNYNNIYDQTPNNNNPSSNTIGQTTPTIQDTEQCYSQNNYNHKDLNVPATSPKSDDEEMPKWKFIRNLILSIFLIIDQLVPIILQIAMNSNMYIYFYA